MSETYVKKAKKDTVKIDPSFFRFFSMYRKEISEAFDKTYGKIKLDSEGKELIAMINNRAAILTRKLKDYGFLHRYLRNKSLRKWKAAFVRLGWVGKAVSIDQPSEFNVDDFIPPQIRSCITFLDEQI
jgi:hypothetical protein